MDGLRRVAIKSYNELIHQLKSGLNEDRNYIVYKDDNSDLNPVTSNTTKIIPIK